jgi:hypothetical protein
MLLKRIFKAFKCYSIKLLFVFIGYIPVGAESTFNLFEKYGFWWSASYGGRCVFFITD